MEAQVTPPHQTAAEKENQEPRTERRLRLAKQVAMLQIVTIGNVANGALLSWSSPALSSLENDNSTLVGTELVLTEIEKDLVGSVVYVGALVGMWLAGWMVTKIGRRLPLQLVSLPLLAGWIIVGLTPNTIVLLIGRLVKGFGMGCLTTAGYIYIVESADTNIRGMMGILPSFGIVLGNLYIAAVGYALPWHYLCFAGTIPVAVFAVGSFILPETPSYLVTQGRRQEAICALRSLRGNYADIEAEVAQLEYINSSSSSGWKGLLNKETLRRISVVVTTFAFSQMSGNYVVIVFTARILKNTGAPMDPDAVTAIAGVPRVAGTLVSFFLMDRLGRRPCLLVSHAINAVCMVILGSYVYLGEAATPNNDIFLKYSWVPVVCVTTSLLAWTLGVQTVPFLVGSEYFPTNIRGQASSICYALANIFFFGMVQLYSTMLALLTQPGLYWFYGCSSIMGVLFTLFALTETKGKAIG